MFEADGRKRLCERKAMAGHVVGAAEPQACASEGTMIRRGSLPLASASSASSVARCSACEVIYARLQFQDLASKPSMFADGIGDADGCPRIRIILLPARPSRWKAISMPRLRNEV
jgi:hypothetical protein